MAPARDSRYCPRGKHKGWDRIPLDKVAAGGWGCPGLLPDGTPCGYESGTVPARTGTGGLYVRLRRDDLDGGWVAECPVLPGCFSQGETREEALRNIADALQAVAELKAE